MSPLPNGSDIPLHSKRFEVTEQTEIGSVRRYASALAKELGLNEIKTGRIGIIVNELGTNLIRHAGGGFVLIRALNEGANFGVELLAVDRGPGIADINKSLTDGYTTGSTPGTGLGAVRRQSDEFDIFSTPGQGTCILSQVWNEEISARNFQYGAVNVPLPGELVSGDAWSVEENTLIKSVVVVDGLGHGLLANQAAVTAVRSFHAAFPSVRGPDFLNQVHNALRSTRGAAVFTAWYDESSEDLHFSAVGNIRGFAWSEGMSKGMISQPGTAGVQMKRSPTLTVPFKKGSLAVFASDGLTSKLDLRPFPGLAMRHPSVIAGVLYREFSRGTDDATVFVGRRV